MEVKELINIVDYAIQLPNESELIEFKHNFHSPEEIGERISALSNSACLHSKPFGYIIFGIEDKSKEVIGTTFKAKSHKKGNEDLEMWLANRLNPRIDFECFEFDYSEGVHISLYRVPAADGVPVTFLHNAYVRVNTMTKKLSEYKAKEAKIWRKVAALTLDKKIIKTGLSASDVISLLSIEAYFDLMGMPHPKDTQGVISRFIDEKLVIQENGQYSITALGAILFAKHLSDFDTLHRKAIRVIVYSGNNKVETIREQTGAKGYAVGFIELIDWINGQLPANEEIGKVLRKDVRMYPEIAIRELVANCIIHQDFNELGFPMVEIYSDRVDISNPGVPLISPERFIDGYISRNEQLADIMRRMKFCEEKGSGLDKTIFNVELYQLPAISINVSDTRTSVTIYSYKKLNDTDKKDRIRACYQHCCLKYISNDKMTNKTLRDRFQIEDKNSAIASRIIRETLDTKLIKEDDPESTSRKHKKYIPFWA